MPNHPGNTKRDCVHANTQGIALSAWTPLRLRRAEGRDPMRMRSMISIGVASLK